MPNLPVDIEKSKRMNNLIERYIELSDDGRNLIDMVAERESKYAHE